MEIHISNWTHTVSFRIGLDSMLKLFRNYINPIGFAVLFLSFQVYYLIIRFFVKELLPPTSQTVLPIPSLPYSIHGVFCFEHHPNSPFNFKVRSNGFLFRAVLRLWINPPFKSQCRYINPDTFCNLGALMSCFYTCVMSITSQ